MPTGEDLLERAEALRGKPYIFGYEIKLTDPNPVAADCSELVQWVCAQEKVKPEMPDGAIYQFRHCRAYGLLIDIEDAKTTPGALLFRIGKNSQHVAFCVGDGDQTFEARGSHYKIGSQPAKGRPWTHAALIPGVEYPEWETEI
jgi:cell wall-associated NlpC family hydrolase